MRLDDTDVEAAYYGLSWFIRQCNLGGRPLPPEVGRLYARLDHRVRLSPTRHENGCADEDQSPSGEETWIGSSEAAQILDWSNRQVQRHAIDLGGQIVGGRWLFRESDVKDYAGRRAGDGEHRPGI
ncbi:hypothetical protein A5791_19825 [Mycobacterium sp. 852002-51163_SCH5372311]|uniref:helix-turn-helix domain-containing protein n=1 Tax=Mycobacterium sp. 852002-51163_SCH5372311 TaxID=1834097 RepID=UPI0007FE786C|nr:helix-turn-helix domain-containing protein [Mycobacterium sp. 852002-51163_SCH5372311]OBF86947.1 hypothetical protein A5791_19825 [Mycobacterium sp. 852002-51163_SCH5372311]